jgi:GntR family transcriptional regulator
VALDQNGAMTLSAQVRVDLVRRINSGQYTLGEKIPSLRALAAEYDVAELTVHAAVKQLQHEGVLESASGRGTFVRAIPQDNRPDSALAEMVTELSAELGALRRRVEALEAAAREP